jgi:hypothetical protein
MWDAPPDVTPCLLRQGVVGTLFLTVLILPPAAALLTMTVVVSTAVSFVGALVLMTFVPLVGEMIEDLQGYLAHKKQYLLRILQQAYA